MSDPIINSSGGDDHAPDLANEATIESKPARVRRSIRKSKSKSKPKPRPVRTLKCLLPGCGIEFQPRCSWQRFHSPKCSATARAQRFRNRTGEKRKSSKRPVEMRQCALPGCGKAFYPVHAWQRFHDPTCASRDRMRRWRERYRKLAAINSGEIKTTAAGRKVVKRGSRERDITREEDALLKQLRDGGQPLMDMVTGMLNGNGIGNVDELPRNRSPEAAEASAPSPPMLSRRLRNIQRVHPRSLEKT